MFALSQVLLFFFCRSDNKEGYVEQAYTDDFVHGGIDDHYDPGKLENIIPVATRKKI